MLTEEEILESTNENLEITEEVLETEEITYKTNEELLEQIHYDLSVITCFLIFFTLVIILKYIYKFFNMIFQF